jgi:hypothetical protein
MIAASCAELVELRAAAELEALGFAMAGRLAP